MPEVPCRVAGPRPTLLSGPLNDRVAGAGGGLGVSAGTLPAAHSVLSLPS